MPHVVLGADRTTKNQTFWVQSLLSHRKSGTNQIISPLHDKVQVGTECLESTQLNPRVQSCLPKEKQQISWVFKNVQWLLSRDTWRAFQAEELEWAKLQRHEYVWFTQILQMVQPYFEKSLASEYIWGHRTAMFCFIRTFYNDENVLYLYWSILHHSSLVVLKHLKCG